MTTLESAWRTLSPWAALPAALGMLRPQALVQALPGLVPLVALVANVEAIGLREVGLGLLGLLALLAAYAVAWQRRFRFRIDERSITVQRGVLQRSEVELGWERVRNVDVRQPFYFRPLDRVALIVEGSGGAEEEVAIQAVDRELAEGVRESIASHQRVATVVDDGPSAATAAAVDHAPAQAVLHQPSTGEILLHGAINGRAFALLLAGIGALFSAGQPLLQETDVLVDVAETVTEQVIALGVAALVLAVPALLVLSVVLVVVSALIALVRFHGFTLWRDDDRFRLRHGLLESRERTLRTSKLQAVTVVETAVGRLLGRCHVLAHQASSAEEGVGEGNDGTAEVPALTAGTVQPLVARFDPAYGRRPPLAAIEGAFLRFWVTRLAGVLVAVGAAGLGALAVWGDASTALLITLAVLLVVAVAAVAWAVHRRWRHWGWTTDGDVAHVASGLLGRRWESFRLNRVQQVTLRRTPFQRRHGLATLAVSLADGDRQVPFLHEADARALANLALFVAEARPHREL